MFCAHSRPQGEKPMVQICERPAAADSDETRVTVLGENHRYFALLRRLALVDVAQRFKQRTIFAIHRVADDAVNDPLHLVQADDIGGFRVLMAAVI